LAEESVNKKVAGAGLCYPAFTKARLDGRRPPIQCL